MSVVIVSFSYQGHEKNEGCYLRIIYCCLLEIESVLVW